MKLEKKNLMIIQDTREQNPLIFPSAKVETGILDTGDYSIKGWENQITIERKSLPDLLNSLGQDRERFFKEIIRLRGFEYSGLIIEAGLKELYSGQWRSHITPQSVIGSLQSISVKHGINVFWAENRTLAAQWIEGILYHYLRSKLQEYEKLKPFLKDMDKNLNE